MLDAWAKKKVNKTEVTVAVAMLSQEVTKEQKRIKLQLYSKQCLIVGSCHGKRIKLDREGELGENFNFRFHFSTSASHSRDIEPCHQSISAAKTLTLNGASIHPSPTLKLLGVVLDQKLKYHEHIGNAVKRGVVAVLALKRPRNLRPETARRLYISTVTPVVDYASVIWAPNASQTVLKQLDKIQRVGCQAITGAFKTVFLLIAESEATLTPLKSRLLKHQLLPWMKWHSKPAHHRFWKIKRTICITNKRFISPL